MITGVSQGSFEQVLGAAHSLVLCASGYESRCTDSLEALSLIRTRDRVAIGFQEQRELKREENDEKLISAGFSLRECEGNDGQMLAEWMDELLGREESPRVVVEYSCMTKAWYAQLLSYFDQRPGRAQCTFIYNIPRFVEPGLFVPNETFSPIPFFESISNPNSRLSLVLGLGYEEGRSLGVSEFLEPHDIFVFKTKPASDARFEKAVEAGNQALLDELSSEKIINYPYNDLIYQLTRLISLCKYLTLESRVIVAPLGPKPFALIALITSLLFDQKVDIWRVSPGKNAKPIDREGTGELLTLNVTFEPTEAVVSF